MDNQPTETDAKTSFQIQRLYVKDISFKLPEAPAIYQEQGQPTTKFELQITNQALQNDHYEVVIQINANATINEHTAFDLTVQQAGIFKLEGLSESQLDHVLKAYCPSLLYPYLCRVVTDTTVQASVPPLLLTPINFDQLYLQQQQQTDKPNAYTSSTMEATQH